MDLAQEEMEMEEAFSCLHSLLSCAMESLLLSCSSCSSYSRHWVGACSCWWTQIRFLSVQLDGWPRMDMGEALKQLRRNEIYSLGKQWEKIDNAVLGKAATLFLCLTYEVLQLSPATFGSESRNLPVVSFSLLIWGWERAGRGESDSSWRWNMQGLFWWLKTWHRRIVQSRAGMLAETSTYWIE